MINEDLQWLLSLSLMSLLGPKVDIDALTAKGFYKKTETVTEMFTMNLSVEGTVHDALIKGYMDDLNIKSRENYYERMDDFISGKGFSARVQRLLQIVRIMSDEGRVKRQPYVVDGHSYDYDFFQALMTYEAFWPRTGFTAYDIANAVMLLRLGMGFGFLEEPVQRSYLKKILPIAKGVFDTYKNFGRDASIGRSVHCNYLKQKGSGILTASQKDVLPMAYYCVWQQIEANSHMKA